jgi:hypothetical protein
MSTMHAAPVRRDLAAVNEAIRYAQTVVPVTPAPEFGGAYYARFEIRVHQVPSDVFCSALVVNDDLPWGAVENYCDEERGEQWWSVVLELPHAQLVLYTERKPLHEEHGHG